MGSTKSRPRLCKVSPRNNFQEEDQARPQWILPALPVSADQPSESVGLKKTTLPPLKREITLSTLSEPCFAESSMPKESNHSSIIHSHPPRRPQALQPLAVQIGQPCTASQIAMGRGCRDGVVQRSSTTGLMRHNGTDRMTQAGFLEAQMAQTLQDRQHRQAHLRHARELRRHKVVYTANVTNTEGVQKVRLVRRPTEMDIFWDETTGQSLDPSCFLESKSLPHFDEGKNLNEPNKLSGKVEDKIQKREVKDPR